MKSDRASRWAQRNLEQEANSGELPWVDWEDFELEFRKLFTSIYTEAMAINTLEGTSYFQGKQSVDDYLDKFLDLISDSGYTDPKTIVVKFRRGLRRDISTALASMATGRPADNDPEEWFQLAVQMDQNRAADEAFLASTSRPNVPIQSQKPRNFIPFARTTPLNSTPTPTPSGNPTPGNPVPMDIDAARKKGNFPSNACLWCRKIGHFRRDCPLWFDVRMLDTDELEAILEHWFMEMDIAKIGTSELLEEDLEHKMELKEDFVSCNK